NAPWIMKAAEKIDRTAVRVAGLAIALNVVLNGTIDVVKITQDALKPIEKETDVDAISKAVYETMPKLFPKQTGTVSKSPAAKTVPRTQEEDWADFLRLETFKLIKILGDIPETKKGNLTALDTKFVKEA